MLSRSHHFPLYYSFVPSPSVFVIFLSLFDYVFISALLRLIFNSKSFIGNYLSTFSGYFIILFLYMS